MSALERFEIAVDDAAIEDLRDRLRRTRWAEDFNNNDWRYGANGEYLREISEYWAEEYDWRAQERAMNAFDHYRVTIDGVPIHFLRRDGKGRRRIPLILSHGWPWSFWDFRDLIVPLSDPASVGKPDDVAFDVIVPSLPGFGFSSPLRQAVSRERMADIWVTLMCDVLGYERFAAHGGDAGAFITANLSHAHADRLIGAHMSFPALMGWASFEGLTPDRYGPGEEDWHARWTKRMATARAHGVVHRASPQTLGFAFNDSPVGLAAWIVERRRLWSDSDGDIESVFSRDDILTLLSIYWFTGTVGTSMRQYADTPLADWQPRHDRTPLLEAPTAMAVFPMDLLLVPRTVFAEQANLKRWTVMPRGGHFGAAEQPDLLADDIRAFFTSL